MFVSLVSNFGFCTILVIFVFCLHKQMDTFVNPLRSSVRNVGNIVRSMPDNFADGVARVSGGFRSIPNNMLDGVGKMLNVKGVSIPS